MRSRRMVLGLFWVMMVGLMLSPDPVVSISSREAPYIRLAGADTLFAGVSDTSDVVRVVECGGVGIHCKSVDNTLTAGCDSLDFTIQISLDGVEFETYDEELLADASSTTGTFIFSEAITFGTDAGTTRHGIPPGAYIRLIIKNSSLADTTPDTLAGYQYAILCKK